MTSREIQQTRASFDYQWAHLPPNRWSLENPEFRDTVAGLIGDLTGLEAGWFAGRDVLDAGCGVGRHVYGFCALGARVTALDQSLVALAETRRQCAAWPTFRGALAADLLQPLPFVTTFDLVWSYGVLHSTGGTREAFRHVCRVVKPGGYVFLMLYGEPRDGHLKDHERLAVLDIWRQHCKGMPFSEKVAALGRIRDEGGLIDNFDAVSPWISDRYEYDELRTWFDEEGLVGLTRRVDDMDHYLVARRPLL